MNHGGFISHAVLPLTGPEEHPAAPACASESPGCYNRHCCDCRRAARAADVAQRCQALPLPVRVAGQAAQAGRCSPSGGGSSYWCCCWGWCGCRCRCGCRCGCNQAGGSSSCGRWGWGWRWGWGGSVLLNPHGPRRITGTAPLGHVPRWPRASPCCRSPPSWTCITCSCVLTCARCGSPGATGRSCWRCWHTGWPGPLGRAEPGPATLGLGYQQLTGGHTLSLPSPPATSAAAVEATVAAAAAMAAGLSGSGTAQSVTLRFKAHARQYLEFL